MSFVRFKGAPWFPLISKSNIFIAGAGGIGSHLAFYLARTGAAVAIVDMDTVDAVNLAGQLYGKNEVGEYKVDAIKRVIENLCAESTVLPIQEQIEEGKGEWLKHIPTADVVCVGLDNLPTRRTVYQEWKENGKTESLFVDGRLSFESGLIFCIGKQDSEKKLKDYESTFYPKEELEELPCTMKATTHCGSLISSLMTAQIINWFSNTLNPLIRREVGNVEFHLPLNMVQALTITVEEHVAAEV